MRLSTGTLSLLLSLPACPVASWCQLAPSPDASPVSTAPASPDEKPKAISTQGQNAVDLFFTVRDGSRNLVPHLSEQNCSVLDDSEPQTLTSFVAETDQPLNLGILLDTSGSQIPWLTTEQNVAGEFIRRILRSKDQAFLASFDVDVDLLQDYTNSPGLLMDGLNKAHVNGDDRVVTKVDSGPVPNRNPRGTLLYDAITETANEKMNQQTGRKALIVLTDGADHGSSATSRDALAAAQKNDVPVYVVWAGSPRCLEGTPRTPGQRVPRGQRMLDDWRAECDRASYVMTPCPGYYVAQCVAEHTGARLIVADDSKKLLQAFQRIEDELRSQYAASYTPKSVKVGGSFHKIVVQCHGDSGEELRVQVRRGYYVP